MANHICPAEISFIEGFEVVIRNHINIQNVVTEQGRTADGATYKPHQDESRKADAFATQKVSFGFIADGEVAVKGNSNERRAANENRDCLNERDVSTANGSERLKRQLS